MNEVAVSSTIDINSITVDSSYEGPILPDDNIVTLQFINDLLLHLKAEKKLHIK